MLEGRIASEWIWGMGYGVWGMHGVCMGYNGVIGIGIGIGMGFWFWVLGFYCILQRTPYE